MGKFFFACTPSRHQMGVLAIAGDSITAGYGLSVGQAWGDQLSTLVGARAYYNGGHSGEYSTNMVSRQAAEITANLSKIGHPVAILEIGSNDIASGLYTTGQCITNWETWITTAQTAGFLVGLCTVLDRSAILSVSQGTFNAGRTTLNAHVRTTTAADFIIDFDADARLTSSSNLTYFQDGVHPTAAGAAIMGGLGNVAAREALAAL